MMIPSFAFIHDRDDREAELDRLAVRQAMEVVAGRPIDFEERPTDEGCVAFEGAMTSRGTILLGEFIEWEGLFSRAVAASRNARVFERAASLTIASRPWGAISMLAQSPPWSVEIACTILGTCARSWNQLASFTIDEGMVDAPQSSFMAIERGPFGPAKIRGRARALTPATRWVETRLREQIPNELWEHDSDFVRAVLKTQERLERLDVSERARIIRSAHPSEAGQKDLEALVAWELSVGMDMLTVGHINRPHLFAMQLERYADDVAVKHDFRATGSYASLGDMAKGLRDELRGLNVAGHRAEVRSRQPDATHGSHDVVASLHDSCETDASHFVDEAQELTLLEGSIRFSDPATRRTWLEVVPSEAGVLVRRKAQ